MIFLSTKTKHIFCIIIFLFLAENFTFPVWWFVRGHWNAIPKIKDYYVHLSHLEKLMISPIPCKPLNIHYWIYFLFIYLIDSFFNSFQTLSKILHCREYLKTLDFCLSIKIKSKNIVYIGSFKDQLAGTISNNL